MHLIGSVNINRVESTPTNMAGCLQMGVSIHSEDNEKDFWYSRYSGLAEYRKLVAELWGYKAYCNIPDPAEIMSRSLAGPGPMNIEALMMQMASYQMSPAYQAETVNAKLNHPGQHLFLYSSDSDGEWTPDECKQMIEELKKVKCEDLNRLSRDRTAHWDPSLGDCHEKFIEGLEYCVTKGQKAIIG